MEVLDGVVLDLSIDTRTHFEFSRSGALFAPKQADVLH